ncbi:CHRNA6 [Mytilus coruscus]|uniref:CHRNA6 n=1 Tax=Mytilus coruscus TaxID=42192 RepID=A0A6J8AQ64_MYTCO|nr:CHRNA6 [Mytilus coruscus]
MNDQYDAIRVTVDFEMSSIHALDEVAEKNSCCRSFESDMDTIWKPEIVLKNGFHKFEELGGSFYYVRVEYDGRILWYPYHVYESQCSIDVTFYPFDEQTCHIILTIWTYRYYEVEIDPDSIFYLGEYIENSLWEMTSTSVHIQRVLGSSEIIFTINLRRKPTYYIVNIIIPLIFLGVLNSLVFIIPADAGEKMSYSVTVFLSFVVFLTIITAQLPVNSECTSILSIYIVIQLSYCILVNSFQLRIHHRLEGNAKSKIFVITVKLQRRMFCWRKKLQSDTNEKGHTKKEDGIAIENASPQRNHAEDAIKWRDVSCAFDFFAFWILMGTDLIIILLLGCYMVDDKLSWNRSAYNDIYDMTVLQDTIWKPDVVLRNGLHKFEELGGSFYYVLVKHDGRISWYPYHMFESQCSMDVSFYPFDEQTCHVIFTIWTYRYYEVGFYRDSKLGLEGYVENSLWAITSTSVQINRVLGSHEIDFTINLRRKPTYYIVNIIIPLLFLSFLNSIVFIIPADAREKMSYSVTVFLSFAVLLTITKAKLPVN